LIFEPLTSIPTKGAGMRHFFRVLIGIIFIFCLSGYASGADSVKVGILDMQRLQQESKNFGEVREALKKKFETLQVKLDKEKSKVIEAEEEFKKQSLMLSLDAKEDKQKELEKKTRYYKYVYEEVTQEMKDAELSAQRKVGREIEKIVEKLGGNEAYTLILEKGTVGLIYYDDSLDITNKVIKAYDLKK
jgi:outer membrane protein